MTSYNYYVGTPKWYEVRGNFKFTKQRAIRALIRGGISSVGNKPQRCFTYRSLASAHCVQQHNQQSVFRVFRLLSGNGIHTLVSSSTRFPVSFPFSYFLFFFDYVSPKVSLVLFYSSATGSFDI